MRSHWVRVDHCQYTLFPCKKRRKGHQHTGERSCEDSCCCCCCVASVVSDSVRPHRWQPTRLPCFWDSPGKNTGVGEAEMNASKSQGTPRSPDSTETKRKAWTGFSSGADRESMAPITP